MIVYSEEKNGAQSTFTRHVLNQDGIEVARRSAFIHLHQVEKDGFIYFLLYDENMNIIRNAYRFLNFHMQNSPLTSRRKTAFALRLFYCFLSLSGNKPTGINEKNFQELIFFLKGISTGSQNYSMETQRSNNTVNGYLSVYRSYFTFAHIKCDVLFKCTTTLVSSSMDEGSFVSKTKYSNNLKSIKPDAYVPKYIGPEEFRKLYKIVSDKKDHQSMIILHLMYGYGLRLGEVLGLTLEDIKEVHDNNKLVPALFLRNRLSDQRFQFAKSLPHVLNEKQYKSKDYRTAQTKIIITYDLYEELIDFINDSHEAAMAKYPENYANGTADIVSIRDIPDSNHYVFLNRYGKILSDQTWNNTLKKYFELAGIPLDIDVRDNNLSHRFRHGFAMFHARFSPHPVDVLALQKLMRHRSLTSTMVYYNPTPEDEFEIKTAFQEDLYNMLPELKKGANFIE